MRRNVAFGFALCLFCLVFLFATGVSAADDAAATPERQSVARRAPVLKSFKQSVDQDEALKKKLLTGTRQESYELIKSNTELASRPRIDKYLQGLTDDQFSRLMTLFVESPDFRSFRRSFRSEFPPVGKNARRRGARHRKANASKAPQTQVEENTEAVQSE